jgi:hypothetical protein
MAARRWMLLCGLVLTAWLATQTISPSRGEQNAPAEGARGATEPDVEKALNQRYAAAYLKLMEATLGRFQEINQRNADIIRPAVIQTVQDGIGKARERLQMAENAEVNDSKVYVLRAESDLRLSEEALKKSEAVNKRAAGTVSAKEIERLKAQIEFEKMKVEKARHLASESPLSNVRFELDQLREDVQELRLNVAILRSGRR